MKKNISQLKRQRQNEKLRERNRGLRSTMRTSIRKARAAIEQDPGSDQTKAVVAEASRIIDRMVTRGLIHGNAAARYKSRLARRYVKGGVGEARKAPVKATPEVAEADEVTEPQVTELE